MQAFISTKGVHASSVCTHTSYFSAVQLSKMSVIAIVTPLKELIHFDKHKIDNLDFR